MLSVEIVNIFVAVESGTLWREKKLEKKSHNAEKLKGATLWGFPTSILTQNSKKLKGGPFGFARYGMLRGKTGKTFLVQFARPNGAIWCNDFL